MLSPFKCSMLEIAAIFLTLFLFLFLWFGCSIHAKGIEGFPSGSLFCSLYLFKNSQLNNSILLGGLCCIRYYIGIFDNRINSLMCRIIQNICHSEFIPRDWLYPSSLWRCGELLFDLCIHYLNESFHQNPINFAVYYFLLFLLFRTLRLQH